MAYVCVCVHIFTKLDTKLLTGLMFTTYTGILYLRVSYQNFVEHIGFRE